MSRAGNEARAADPCYNTDMRFRASASLAPRTELTPLLDVIFLLLTFFIYSQVLLVRAQIMPVELPPLTTGQPAQPQRIVGITIDRDGQLFVNQKPHSREELEKRLQQVAQADPQPKVYLAVSQQSGQTDRGPIVINLIELIRANGIENFAIVGQPAPRGASELKTGPPDEAGVSP